MEKQANYKGTDHIGKNGLEQHYEFELHGETGYEEVEIDAGGRALRSLKRIPPVSGNNLSLIDGALPESRMSLTFGNVQWMTVAPLVVRVGWTPAVAGFTSGMAEASSGVNSSVETGAGIGTFEAMGLFSSFRIQAINGPSQTETLENH